MRPLNDFFADYANLRKIILHCNIFGGLLL